MVGKKRRSLQVAFSSFRGNVGNYATVNCSGSPKGTPSSRLKEGQAAIQLEKKKEKGGWGWVVAKVSRLSTSEARRATTDKNDAATWAPSEARVRRLTLLLPAPNRRPVSLALALRESLSKE